MYNHFFTLVTLQIRGEDGNHKSVEKTYVYIPFPYQFSFLFFFTPVISSCSVLTVHPLQFLAVLPSIPW